MAMLADAFARKSLNTYDIFRDLIGRRVSASGRDVSVNSALEVATVFACLRVRANGVAQVPLKLMRESADGRQRKPAKDHSLYKILETQPNEWQTSFEYRQMLMFHLCLTGNAFSFINRSNRSGIMELIPFDPGCVTVKRADDFTMTYDVRAQNGSTQTFPAKAIWHVRGPSWDGWRGMRIVETAREAIGLAMAIEEQQAQMQKNGVNTSGVYSVEGILGDDKYKALKKWVDENHAGSVNTGNPMIMDRSAKWLPLTMTGIDAQTLETRRFQVEEMCRQLGVNPIMVFAESKNTTYASAEQQFLAHLVHTIAPDYTMLEQSIYVNLLTDADRADGLYADFVEEGLLRGSSIDTKDTILGYVNGGLLTVNEGRALMDKNPMDDAKYDELREPANITGDTPAAAPAKEPPKGTP